MRISKYGVKFIIPAVVCIIICLSAFMFFGDELLENDEAGNIEQENILIAGVNTKSVISDNYLLNDTYADWEQSNVEVIAQYTDVESKTDTFVVLMDLKNDYVNMTGMRKIIYQYNEQSDKWEPGSVSKIKCLTMEPLIE
ncbi:MAG: hypothetical protein PHV71_03235 [Eubacteriales bacterium]|nr:hypothetical protein [Eubacteriales bacterium]MDD3198912.1 hypothetical protein [Eubacteriales bacterium]MDD4122342.1 hypothetical protein [Eubacteriales bacterium]MDD4629601.1 hypothetical protein [Eubacteriales bacterium]